MGIANFLIYKDSRISEFWADMRFSGGGSKPFKENISNNANIHFIYTENLVYINAGGLIEHMVIGSKMVLSTLYERELGLEKP